MDEKKEKWSHFKSIMEHCLDSGDSFEDAAQYALNGTKEHFSQPKFQKAKLCTVNSTGNHHFHDTGEVHFVVGRGGEVYVVTSKHTVVFDKEDGAWGEFECDEEIRDYLGIPY